MDPFAVQNMYIYKLSVPTDIITGAIFCVGVEVYTGGTVPDGPNDRCFSWIRHGHLFRPGDDTCSGAMLSGKSTILRHNNNNAGFRVKEPDKAHRDVVNKTRVCVGRDTKNYCI